MSTVTLTSSWQDESSPAMLPYAWDLVPSSPSVGESRHRYTTWVGLTLCLGTIGVISSQMNPAIAANHQGTNLNYLPTLNTPSPSPSIPEISAPSLKHEVKQGESLWALAQKYQVDPQELAQFNQISLQSDLTVGQSLNIPTLNHPSLKSTPLTAANPEFSPIPLSEVNPASGVQKTLETPEEHLEQTRELLTERLTTLNAETGRSASDVPEITPAVADVSEPLNPSPSPELATLAPTESQSIPIQVIDADGEEIKPILEESPSISITVPTPETHQAAVPSPSPEVVITPNSFREPYRETEQPRTVIQQQPQEQAYRPIPSQNSENWADTVPVTIPQPTVTTPANLNTYQVQAGDTLNVIARRHGVSLTALIQANDIRNPNIIRANQTLIIPKAVDPKIARQSAELANLSFPKRQPSAYPVNLAVAPPAEDVPFATEKLKQELNNLQTDYTRREIPVLMSAGTSTEKTLVGEAINPEWDTKSNENVSRVPSSLNVATKAVQPQLISTATDNDSYNNRFQIPVGTTVSPELPALSFPEDYLPETPMKFTGYMWPAKGVLTSGYGRRWGRMHRGIDIAAPIGTPIVAAASGEVITAGWNSGGYGNLVKVRHPDGSVTLYGHNSRLLVRRGQTVEQGQLIAEMGSTGYSTGPHLHFEVHPNGQGARNPIAFLPGRNR